MLRICHAHAENLRPRQICFVELKPGKDVLADHKKPARILIGNNSGKYDCRPAANALQDCIAFPGRYCLYSKPLPAMPLHMSLHTFPYLAVLVCGCNLVMHGQMTLRNAVPYAWRLAAGNHVAQRIIHFQRLQAGAALRAYDSLSDLHCMPARAVHKFESHAHHAESPQVIAERLLRLSTHGRSKAIMMPAPRSLMIHHAP